MTLFCIIFAYYNIKRCILFLLLESIKVSNSRLQTFWKSSLQKGLIFELISIHIFLNFSWQKLTVYSDRILLNSEQWFIVLWKKKKTSSSDEMNLVNSSLHEFNEFWKLCKVSRILWQLQRLERRLQSPRWRRACTGILAISHVWTTLTTPANNVKHATRITI